MDIKLFYQEEGQGTPMLLLHGNGEDSSYFAYQIADFSRCFHVFAIDTRGHGRSPRGMKPFTIRQFACDLCDFMDAHGLPSAILLGFSDGANIAMEFTLCHPGAGTGADPERRESGSPWGQACDAAAHRDRLPDRQSFCRSFPRSQSPCGAAGVDGQRATHRTGDTCTASYTHACDLWHEGHDQGIPHPTDRRQPSTSKAGIFEGRSLYCKQMCDGI